MRALVAPLLAALVLAPACEKEKDAPPPKVLGSEEDPTPATAIGVYPDDFRCESVAALPDVGRAVGATVTLEASGFTPPFGTPPSCNYAAVAGAEPAKPTKTDAAAGSRDAGAPAAAVWSFDLDCRQLALRDAGKLMADYAKHPEAVAVQVGKSGVDHRDTVLLFVDDDTPCYARVIGPGRQARIALAKLVAAGLTPTTAPTRVLR